jgi:hypothetical protein
MSPALDQDLRLQQRIEELAVEKLGAELPIERFLIAVLPGAAGLDEQAADAQQTQPLPDRRRDTERQPAADEMLGDEDAERLRAIGYID